VLEIPVRCQDGQTKLVSAIRRLQRLLQVRHEFGKILKSSGRPLRLTSTGYS
jgi:hypothetical protein